MHRGGPTSSSIIHPEHCSMETSSEHHHQMLDDSITSSSSVQQDKQDMMPSTPERTSHSMTLFSSSFSDDSTPTKVLDVARKNC